ncbi:MAG: hypothetical protein VB062_01485 [Christensenella sp.]|nr:hypothetical protein [Christensenella sp.]
MQNNNLSTEKITIISIGRHTRLGDALEYALEGVPFETMEAGDLAAGDWTNRRLLFAASADPRGENAALLALAVRLRAGECDLSGCICAMIADGEQGGAIHLDAIRLLLAANSAGAEIISCPLLESGRDLHHLATETGGKETGFACYRALARALTLRLRECDNTAPIRRSIRLSSALDAGTKNDWCGVIRRMVAGCEIEISEDDAETDDTILLCENNDSLPDSRTLALLGGSGRIQFLIASPGTGGDLYTAVLFERACLRGEYSLVPGGITLLEGKSAVEALASKGELELVKASLNHSRKESSWEQ